MKDNLQQIQVFGGMEHVPFTTDLPIEKGDFLQPS